MFDKMTREQRSRLMARIKNKNTKPEIKVRKFLFENGFRYRLHKKNLPGRPDIVLTKYKTVIFIQGCFWHHHAPGCRSGEYPKSNIEYWEKKIKGNVARDKQNEQNLKLLGWQVLEVWECELAKSKFEKTLNTLINKIREAQPIKK